MAHSLVVTYSPFRGLYLYPVFPCWYGGFYPPTPLYGPTSCQIFFPPGPGNLFFLCFPFTTIFLFHFSFYFHFVSPLPFPLLFTNLFSFFFSPFSLFHFLPFHTIRTLFLLSLFTLFWHWETYIPPGISVLLNYSLFWYPSSLRFSVLHSTSLHSLVSPPCMW